VEILFTLQHGVQQVSSLAGVEGHTPHDACHAMGRHFIEKAGNIAAVHRQVGHAKAAYFIQYARVTDQELAEALDDRRSAFQFS
jgi:site-specific recombinase XerC